MSWSKLWSRRKPEEAPAPVDPEVAYAEGMAAWNEGRLDDAQRLLAASVAAAPSELRYVGNLGNLHHQAGRLVEALACHQKAAELAPDHPVAHRNQGRVLAEMGRYIEAARALEQSLDLDPTHADTAVLCAQAWASSGDTARAFLRCEASTSAGARSAELSGMFIELVVECARFDAAPVAALLPGIPTLALHQLGLRCLRANHPVEAAQVLKQALEQDPDNASTAFHLGIAQKNAGDRLASQASFARATQLAPADPRSRGNLGWLQLQSGDIAGALDSMTQAAHLETLVEVPAEELSAVPAHRIRHDAEQFQYILENAVLAPESQAYADAIIRLDRGLRGTASTVDLTQPEHDVIRAGWTQNHHLPDCPALPEGALNPALDLERLQSDYHAARPEMVVIDDLLRPEALHALQRWCREATVWKRTYDNGYVGAFMRSGLATPLMVQLAEELRLALPAIMGEHRLEQCWAFKCDNTKKGVNLHADVAAINVNFWISPDEANEEPERGGLLVWDVESPADWPFADYNGNQAKMRQFLEASGAQSVRVPHRCNRALVFNSTLFHETDQIVFRPDYTQRRVNITLLYGIRLLEN